MIVEVIEAQGEERAGILRQWVSEAPLRGDDITFEEVVGYRLLPKITFVEEKFKESKVTLARVKKLRETLHEKIKGGFKRINHLEQQYSKAISAHIASKTSHEDDDYSNEEDEATK